MPWSEVTKDDGQPRPGRGGGGGGAAAPKPVDKSLVDGPVINMQDLLCAPEKWRAQVEDDGKSAAELDPAIDSDTVYYWRLEGPYDGTKRFVDTRIFQYILEQGSIVIVSGTTKELEGVDQMDCLRRREARPVVLETLSTANLAKVTLQLAMKEGYKLGGHATEADENVGLQLERTVPPPPTPGAPMWTHQPGCFA